jgi:hypothetical protein
MKNKSFIPWLNVIAGILVVLFGLWALLLSAFSWWMMIDFILGPAITIYGIVGLIRLKRIKN